MDFESRWNNLEKVLEERFGKLPDLEGILFLIGVNELGWKNGTKFTKEQKQDLMHVAVCLLLSPSGYFQFTGKDDEGWPHFTALKAVEAKGMNGQERLIKESMLNYFEC